MKTYEALCERENNFGRWNTWVRIEAQTDAEAEEKAKELEHTRQQYHYLGQLKEAKEEA